jgi:nitrogen fixation protein FixH
MNRKQKASLSPRPRELTGRMVLVCLLAFFGVVVGVNMIMVRAATSTFAGIETDNAYNAGLAFEQELAAAHQQNERGWRVTGNIGRPNQDAVLLELKVRDHNGEILPGLEVDARLVHPADVRRDQPIAVTSDGRGTFRGTAHAEAGQWTIEVDLSREGERVFRSRSKIFLR